MGYSSGYDMKKNVFAFILGILAGTACIWTLHHLATKREPTILYEPQNKAQALQGSSSSPLSAQSVSGLAWPTGNVEDLKVLASTLQASGCPERLVRDIVIAEANRTYFKKLT